MIKPLTHAEIESEIEKGIFSNRGSLAQMEVIGELVSLASSFKNVRNIPIPEHVQEFLVTFRNSLKERHKMERKITRGLIEEVRGNLYYILENGPYSDTEKFFEYYKDTIPGQSWQSSLRQENNKRHGGYEVLRVRNVPLSGEAIH